MCQVFIIHSPVGGQLVPFHCLPYWSIPLSSAIVNKAAVNLGKQRTHGEAMGSGYVCRGGTAGSYGVLRVCVQRWNIWIVQGSQGRCPGVEQLDHTGFSGYVPRGGTAGSYGASGYVPRGGTAGSYGSFNFLRNLQTDFHNGCVNLHLHQQWIRAPFLQNILSNICGQVAWWQSLWQWWGSFSK